MMYCFQCFKACAFGNLDETLFCFKKCLNIIDKTDIPL